MDSTVNIEPEQDKPHDLSMKPTNHQNVTENQNYNTVVSQKNNPNASAGHGGGTTTLQTNQNQQRKVKKYHIPPPLDLNAHTYLGTRPCFSRRSSRWGTKPSK